MTSHFDFALFSFVPQHKLLYYCCWNIYIVKQMPDISTKPVDLLKYIYCMPLYFYYVLKEFHICLILFDLREFRRNIWDNVDNWIKLLKTPLNYLNLSEAINDPVGQKASFSFSQTDHLVTSSQNYTGFNVSPADIMFLKSREEIWVFF